MPNIFSKDNYNNLNLNPIVYLHNVVPLDHITDYRLFDLGNGEKININVLVRDVKSFVPDLCRLIVCIVFLLIVILIVLIKSFRRWSIASPKI